MGGQIGLEDSPDAFVASMVGVFREVWRVLRDDGTCWLNLGDSYANDTKWGGNGSGPTSKNYTSGLGGCGGQKLKRNTGLKPKDLAGIPWRVALALQADGWTLRSDIIWHKRSPMPESVTDRPTKSHEYLFLLSKQERYYYDAEAVKQKCTSRQPAGNKVSATRGRIGGGGGWDANPNPAASIPDECRNLRTVWRIPDEANEEEGTSHRARVALGVLCGDTMHIVSPDCPLHGSLGRLDSTEPRDACGYDSTNRNSRTDDHHGPSQQDGFSPIGHPCEPSNRAQNLDSSDQPYSPTATRHSSRSNKMAPDPSTNPPCTPCDRMTDRTADTQEQLGSSAPDLGTCENSISSGGSVASPSLESLARIAGKRLAAELRGASVKLLEENGCTCEFYQRTPKKSSHFATLPSVWSITSDNFRGAHFATFPRKLVEPCIKAGTSEKGCCPSCGSPWKRVTERTQLKRDRPNDYVKRTGEEGTGNSCSNSVAGVSVKTVGWEPGCPCPESKPVPCTVFDPFNGAGTTGVVATGLGRDYVGTDLNRDYLDMAKARIERPHAPAPRNDDEAESMPLFA